MTLRCFSGDGSGDGGGDDGGLAQLDDGEGDMSDSNPITTTTPSDDDGSMTTVTPMTSEESGDEFGSLPDESGDMMGEEEEDQVRRGKSSP